MACDIHHKAGKNLDLTLLALDPHIGNSGVLDRISQLSGHIGSLFRENLACSGVHNSLRKLMADNSFIKMKFFVEFITSHLGQIISSGVEEHGHDQALGALYSQRLAGADLLI